jgi:hypothetical protein
MDQKLKEKPQNKVARVQIDDPTPISLNGFTLQTYELRERILISVDELRESILH